MVGAGAWGTALAAVLARGGHEVGLWCRRAEQARLLTEQRENRAYLPGVSLPESLFVTDSPKAAEGAEWIVLVVPSHGLRETLSFLSRQLPNQARLISATKGIENDSLLLMSEVVADVLGPSAAARFVALSGPSFAMEVAQGLPTNIVAAAVDDELARGVQRLFSTEWLRVYTSDDVAGVEIGGALKNVIATAAGAADGLGFGQNTRAALITRGVAEIARMVLAKQGKMMTVAGLSGIGDLILTCTGDLSRNRRLGYLMGQGQSLEQASENLGGVAEGVRTAKSAHDLALKLGVDLPICSAVYRVLSENQPPRDAVRELLARPLKREWD